MDFSSSLSQYRMSGTELWVSLAMGILGIVAMWRIFTKAGEAGWKSLIPIYNTYILWKIAGVNFLKLLLSVVILFLGIFVLGFIAGVSGAGESVAGLIALVLYFGWFIYLLVQVCKYCDGLSKAFGHGGGFAVGLFFLHPIFLLILGFNGDQYNGNN